MEDAKDRFITVLRWIFFLPGAAVCSYLFYILFLWLNKSTPYTNFDKLWNYLVLFASHFLMGTTFVVIGALISPSWKKTCATILFGIACILVGISIFATLMAGFSWISFISELCLLGGASYGLYYCFKEDI